MPLTQTLRRLRPAAALAALAAATALLALSPAPASADAACDRSASPTGSDSNPGTPALPVRSIARLIAITGAGEDGCLPPGATFVEPLGTFIVSSAGGSPGNPATIRSEDPAGPPAQIKGAMWLKTGVHDLVFQRVRFTESPGGDRSTMLVVHGDRITFRQTEMTWRRGICLNAGSRQGYVAGDPAGTEAAEDLLIEASSIHDCGNHPDLVAQMREAGQSGVHGLYLINAPRAVIRDNHVYDNLDRGIQFWPDVDNAVVEHNVFDGNGSNVNIGSSAAYGHFSEGNSFRNNIVSNAVLRSVYDQPWGPGDTESIVGNFPADGNSRGNVLDGNCIHQADPAKRFGGQGYVHVNDVFGDPLYENRAAKDFDLLPGSPCAGKGPRAGLAPPPPVCEGSQCSVAPSPSPPQPAPPGPGAEDVTAPRISLLARPCPRAGARRIVLRLRSSERATLIVTLRRLLPGGSRRVLRVRIVVRAGTSRRVLDVRRRGRGVPPGRYRLILRAVDGAGNRSALTRRTLRVPCR